MVSGTMGCPFTGTRLSCCVIILLSVLTHINNLHASRVYDLRNHRGDTPPVRPTKFDSPDLLDTYLAQLSQYYKNIGRPRYGKRSGNEDFFSRANVVTSREYPVWNGRPQASIHTDQDAAAVVRLLGQALTDDENNHVPRRLVVPDFGYKRSDWRWPPHSVVSRSRRMFGGYETIKK